MTACEELAPLGQQIDERRKHQGMTAKRFYAESGISHAAFYRKMKGEVSFTIDDLKKIAAVLNCSIEVLLTPDEH